MSLFPNAAQRRANRRPPLSRVIGVGIIVGVAIAIAGLVHGDGTQALVDGLLTGVMFVIVLGTISATLRARDRRRR